jgi:hypothetical protein
MRVDKDELLKKKEPPYRRKAHRSLSYEISVKSKLKHLAPAGRRSGIINLSLDIFFLSFWGATARLGPRPPIVEVSRLHTHTHTHTQT